MGLVQPRRVPGRGSKIHSGGTKRATSVNVPPAELGGEIRNVSRNRARARIYIYIYIYIHISLILLLLIIMTIIIMISSLSLLSLLSLLLLSLLLLLLYPSAGAEVARSRKKHVLHHETHVIHHETNVIQCSSWGKCSSSRKCSSRSHSLSLAQCRESGAAPEGTATFHTKNSQTKNLRVNIPRSLR